MPPFKKRKMQSKKQKEVLESVRINFNLEDIESMRQMIKKDDNSFVEYLRWTNDGVTYIITVGEDRY